MNASLKLLSEESTKLERYINIKITQTRLPINILSTKEIQEIKKTFQDFTARLDRLFLSFSEEKEQKITQGRKIDESEKAIEKEFEAIREKCERIKGSIEYLNEEFEKIRAEELNSLRRNKKYGMNSEKGSDNSSIASDVGEQDNLVINKVFLNSIVTTNNIVILQSKLTLEEERQYILEMFKLKDLFPSSTSKQLILVDFFMNIYRFAIEEKYTIQQISTIFSIFYFLFSYSFINSNIVIEKSLLLFNNIVDFHTKNRPPFSYEIFNQEEKEKIINFGKMTLFRNYSLFENIFQYEVSICFFSRDPKPIPVRQFPDVTKKYILNEESLRPTEELPEILKKIIDEGDIGAEIKDEEEVAQVDNQQEKTQEELETEKRIEKMRNFVESFYKSSAALEQQRKIEEDKKIKEENEKEGNQARGFIEAKIGEVKKEVDEKISLCTRVLVDPVNKELSEREAAKKKK